MLNSFSELKKTHNLRRKIEVVVLEYSRIDIVFSRIFKIN
jgi:hypothetical protein